MPFGRYFFRIRNESMIFSVYCHSKRGDSNLGIEIEQWFYAAMAIAGCNSGIWGRVLLSVAGFAYHTGWSGLRDLVRSGYRAYNTRGLACAGTIPRRARHPRIGAYRRWGDRPECIFQDYS